MVLDSQIKSKSESEKLMADMNKRFDEAEERRNKRLSLSPERPSVGTPAMLCRRTVFWSKCTPPVFSRLHIFFSFASRSEFATVPAKGSAAR